MFYNLVKDALNEYSENLNCHIPATIENYNEAEQSASVKIVINRRLMQSDGSYSGESQAVIPSVPVIFMRSGGASLDMPVERGDGCLLLFCDRSLDKWLDEGGVVTPDDGRTHALKDAVAIMGLQPFVGGEYPADNDNVRLRYKKASLTINKDGKIALGNDKEELLDLLDQLLDLLISSTTATAIGAQPLSVVPDITQLKSKLAKIKGVL